MARKSEDQSRPVYTGEPNDIESPPSPDGQDYVLVDKPHETIVGYQEQVLKSEADSSGSSNDKSNDSK